MNIMMLIVWTESNFDLIEAESWISLCFLDLFLLFVLLVYVRMKGIVRFFKL